MDKHEIKEELKMPYEELLLYLIKKYGGAKCDYFANSECRSKSKKISRTKEGLYCHHMDEDKGGNLGNPPQAQRQPFEWQKKERLVYCNILEHLILHMKIAVLRQKRLLKEPRDIGLFFTTQGIWSICVDINDMFVTNGTNVTWKKRCFEEIKENYDDYIALIRALMNYIETDYVGSKSDVAFLVPGSIMRCSDGDYEIVKVSAKKNKILLKLPSGEIGTFYSDIANAQLTYADCFDLAIREMASGYDSFYPKIYKDIQKYDNENLIIELSSLFKVDYRGYGFAQYEDILLEKSFGSYNADEYISKALPMYCKDKIDSEGKTPKFWKGTRVPKKVGDSFYIIRIECSFYIKEGMEPFVRYRETDWLRNFSIGVMNNNHNLKNKGWTVLATSDIYDKKSGKYYSQHVDKNGKIVDARVILTLGKEDFLLFKERYEIQYLKILDGCYFE